jgi:hypothetical protein
MTGRKRGVLIGVGVLAILTAAEVALEWARSPQACVLVENLGDAPIEDLVLTAGAAREAVAPVGPGATAVVYVAGRAPATLQVRFRQRGNAMTSYELPGFDPPEMSRDGSRLVLKVRPNEVERFQEEGDPTTPMGRYARDVWRRINPLADASLP